LLAGFAGATLVRFAPGFEVDQRALDPRLSTETVERINHERKSWNDIPAFYFHFMRGLLAGNAGQSVVFGAPVANLIRDRTPQTARTVGAGLALAWAAGLVFATAAVLFHSRTIAVVATLANGSLLSIPSAVLAAFALLLNVPSSLVVAGVVCPRIFATAHELLATNMALPHVVCARARGLGALRVFVFHTLPPALLPLLALMGVSASLALGASIPVEVYMDEPGLGQLAWQAALGRDLPVLVAITLLIAALTVACNAISDLIAETLPAGTA
jgi:peptide/nickel transport system permease protein